MTDSKPSRSYPKYNPAPEKQNNRPSNIQTLLHFTEGGSYDHRNRSEKSTEVTPVSSKGSLFSFDEFDHFFDDFLSRKWPRLFDAPRLIEPHYPAWLEKGAPKVDIIDYNDKVEAQAALPGVKKEDLDVSIKNQLITIRAVSKEEKEEKKDDGKYYRREISRGEFLRTLLLPDNVDDANAGASFNDGILN
jgi:HSP20 family protein